MESPMDSQRFSTIISQINYLSIHGGKKMANQNKLH